MELAKTLYLDCGNTQAKYRFGTDYGVLPYDDLPAFIAYNSPGEVVYSSVAGERGEITAAAELMAIKVSRCTVEQGFAGLVLAYQDVSKLGVDRWLAMLRARELVEEGVLWIADAGTALTIDRIDANNLHAGGVIAPGLGLSARSLFANTEDLPEISVEDATGLGTDTRSCINYGVVYGAVALIESTVLRFSGSENQLVITGGDAELISRHMCLPFLHQPNLVVDGLYLYWKLKNSG